MGMVIPMIRKTFIKHHEMIETYSCEVYRVVAGKRDH